MTPLYALRQLTKTVPPGPFRMLARLMRRYGRANVILAIAVAVPLLANAVLIVLAAAGNSERASLTSQVQETQAQLDARVKAKATAVAARPTAVPSLPTDVDSADVMDRLLRLTQESSTELVAVDEQGVTNHTSGGQDYRAFKYNVQVRARVSQLVAFLNRLEQTQQSPLIVQSFSANPKDGQNWLVTVDLVTYAKPK